MADGGGGKAEGPPKATGRRRGTQRAMGRRKEGVVRPTALGWRQGAGVTSMTAAEAHRHEQSPVVNTIVVATEVAADGRLSRERPKEGRAT